ncbi:hypothetical protein LTR28_013532, partial [Elasticomyces elasticus]
TLAPIYEELAISYESSKSKVSIAKVDADEHKELGRRFGVQGFPTLKWFDGKSDKPEDYKGGRDLESLTAFVQEKTGIKPKGAKKTQSHVEMLNDRTFKTQSLAPTWETLAADFAAEPTVLIAKVDAEAENAKATAKDQGVTSYPTIKYFPKGSKEAIPYTGGRSEDDLISFMNEKAGTHRVSGGGLDAMAGTIAALDSIVAKFTGGEAIATVGKEASAAAQGLKDKYAEYYVKVFGKVEQNQGYVEKELNRIGGLLKKGGLAPEKIDDLTSRSNILRKFKAVAQGKEEL